MASEERRLIKNSAIYSIFTILQRAFNVVLLPVYTSHLTADEYGILSLMLATIPLITLLLGLSFRGSVSYFYYNYKDQPIYLKRLLGTSFTSILVFTSFVISLLFLFNETLFNLIFENIQFYPYIFLALLSTLFQPAYLYYQSLLRTQHKAKKSSVLDMVFFISTIILTLVFILVLELKAEGALLALAISNFIVFVISIKGISHYITYCFDFKIFKETIKYSLPILPHNLAGWATNLSDRLILNYFSTLSIVASFDIGSQVGKIISIVSMGINQAYNPWFIQQTKSENENRFLLARSAETITTIYFVLAISVTIISPELINFLGNSNYQDSWKIVPFIALSFALNGFYFCFTSVFFLNNTKYLPLLTIAGAVVNIGMNLLLIPFFGILGAAVARLISKIIFVILTYKKSQSLYKIPYNITYLFLMFIISVAICSLMFLFPSFLVYNNHIATIPLKLLFIIVIISLLLLSNKEKIRSILIKKYRDR